MYVRGYLQGSENDRVVTIAPLKPLSQMNWNLVGTIRPDPLTNMATTGDSFFWLADFLDSSPLKPHGQMIQNLVGNILGRSSITVANLVPIRQQTWPPQEILISDWLISKKIFSETALPNESYLGRKHPWKILYIKIAHFVPIHVQTWPPQAILFSDWSIS